MNNKQLQAELAKELSITQKEAADFMKAFVSEYIQKLEGYEEGQAPFLKMGLMKIKKKQQRVIVNPGTKKRMLVPPKFVLAFQAGTQLKNAVKGMNL